MSRELRDKRNELLMKSRALKKEILIDDLDYEKGNKIMKQQDKVYNQWKFYDNFIKANEKIKEKENEK